MNGQAEQIYHQALNIKEEDRNAYLSAVCDGDANLYNEVEALFAANASNRPQSEIPTKVLQTTIDVFPPTVISYPTRDFTGQMIGGRYQITGMLDSGGIGEVYLAIDKPEMFSRKVVIKVLKEKSLQNQYVVKKFRQEIEALTRLEGVAGTVGIIDAGLLPNSEPFLVMRFVEGVPLRKYMKPEVGMEFEYVAEIMKQVCNTLTDAHNKGIFHRDLKPENIMVEHDERGRWKVTIIDFGIARILDSEVAATTIANTVSGTVHYMSPEHLLKLPAVAASDVYSLGIIAYEMLTGRKPFNPETPFQILEMHRAGVQIMPQALRPSTPVAAQNVILKALSFDFESRYQSTKEFGDELSSALLFKQSSQNQLNRGDAENRKRNIHGFVYADAENKRQKQGISKAWLLLPVVLLFGLLFVGIAVAVIIKIKNRESQNTATGKETTTEKKTVPTRTFTYWLIVKMCKDNEGCKDANKAVFGKPFESTGEQVFNNGTMFNFCSVSPQEGRLYVINQGRGENNSEKWTAIFPNPKDNKGNARLDANLELKTFEMKMDEYTGAETLWIIWAEKNVNEIQELFDSAFMENQAEFKSASQQEILKKFLSKYSVQKHEISIGESPPRVIVKGSDEIIVVSRKLTHQNY